MSARDRKLILVALLFTAVGVAAYVQFVAGPGTVATNGPATNAGAIPPARRIDMDLMNGSEARASAGRNPFNFERPVIVVPPPPPMVIPPPPPPPPQPVINRNPNPTPVTTPPVNNVPNVPLQYTGYARDDDNKMVAFLETNGQGAPAGHYNLREDDFLLGRFRVNKISPDSIEVEDMERAETASNRKQTINISPQIAVKR